jgi:lipopolysaccharide cholinephosphotransferase
MLEIGETGIKIREVQKTQLEILLEFDRICKKHNIIYQLFAGTLLGSIRHKGFIPWDDDIDVCLLRDDYERFLEVCNKDLDNKYFLQTYASDPNYIMQFAKLRKNNTVFLEKVTANCDIHHGVYIDIFPLDYVRPSTFAGKLQQKLLYCVGRVNLTRIRNLCTKTDSKLQRSLRLAAYYFMKVIPRGLTNGAQNRLCTIFKKNSDKMMLVSHLTNGASDIRLKKYMMKESDFHVIIEGEFEGYKFPIPQNYDEVLRNLFGNYKELPPVEARKPHHGIIKIQL